MINMAMKKGPCAAIDQWLTSSVGIHVPSKLTHHQEAAIIPAFDEMYATFFA